MESLNVKHGASLFVLDDEAATTRSNLHLRVRVSVKNVLDIDIVTQCFVVRLQLEVSWIVNKHSGRAAIDKMIEDARKQAEENNTKPRDKTGSWKIDRENGGAKLLEAFDPRLSFINLMGAEEEKKWYSLYADPGEDPVVCLRWALVGTFQEPLELKAFPFDVQDLPVKLKSTHPIDRVRLVKNQNIKYLSYISTNNFVLNSDYKLNERIKFEPSETHALESASQRVYSVLSVIMHVDRISHYWIWHIYVPLFLISTCALASYPMKVSDTEGDYANRIATNLGVLFVLVGYQNIIGSQIPRKNYITFADMYMIGCLLFVLFIMLEQTLFEVFAPYAIDLDGVDLGLRISFGLWVVVHLLVLAYVVFKWLLNKIYLLLGFPPDNFWLWEQNAVWVRLQENFASLTPEERAEKELAVLQEMRRIAQEPAKFAIVWNPADAANMLKDHQKEKADTYKVVPYTRKSCFAVVVYQNNAQAKAAKNKFNGNTTSKSDAKVSPVVLKDEAIELLSPSWRSWCNRFSDSNMENARDQENTVVELKEETKKPEGTATSDAKEESEQKKVSATPLLAE